ncbi:MAG: hypothetical protein RL318_3146 [Fibrobacterota bacterium]|jgi:precorrin isomerase
MECLMRKIMTNPVTGEEIERRSLACIDAGNMRGNLSDNEWILARRLVHTTADLALPPLLRFHGQWEEAGAQALRRKAPIYCDSNMIASGLSIARLREIHPDYSRQDVHVLVADPEVARLSKESGLPRSFHAVQACAPWLDGAICLFGNAPVGLAELMRLHLEEGIRPAWVAAMPVGFVHVVESKEEFLESALDGVALTGLRGGSPLAVASLHALCTIAKARP